MTTPAGGTPAEKESKVAYTEYDIQTFALFFYHYRINEKPHIPVWEALAEWQNKPVSPSPAEQQEVGELPSEDEIPYTGISLNETLNKVYAILGEPNKEKDYHVSIEIAAYAGAVGNWNYQRGQHACPKSPEAQGVPESDAVDFLNWIDRLSDYERIDPLGFYYAEKGQRNMSEQKAITPKQLYEEYRDWLRTRLGEQSKEGGNI